MNPDKNKPSFVSLALHHSNQQINSCTQPQAICESIEQCLAKLNVSGFYRLDCQGFSHTSHLKNGQPDLYNNQLVQKASDSHSSKIIELENHLVFKVPHIQLSISRRSECFSEIEDQQTHIMNWLLHIAAACQI